jgi:four helix bundle protein
MPRKPAAWRQRGAIRRLFRHIWFGMSPAARFAMSTDHRKLDAFLLADEMAIRVYQVTNAFPPSERYGLQAQIRRAAISVSTNIVEGCARDTDREHTRYYEIAFASSREVIYLIDLASRLEFIDKAAADRLVQLGGRVAAALAALRRSIS